MRVLQCRNHRDGVERPHRCKIYEIGIGRCATRSICLAMEQFGLEAVHGFGKCSECEMDGIEKHLRRKIDFSIYSTCDYSSNVSSIHWERLLDTYPDSRFVLPIRPLEKWLHKWQRNPNITNGHLEKLLSGRITFGPFYELHHFGMVTYEREVWKEAYEKHNEKVLNAISPDRLLYLNVFEMSDEELWTRIAKFLDCKVPSPMLPFPNTNQLIRHNLDRKD